MQSYREAISYSNADLELLFVGWFEQGDESKGAKLFQIAEIELLAEIDDQMPYIKYICKYHPSVGPEDLRIHVEPYARFLAFKREHRNPDEPLGDADKRLRAYWNDQNKRNQYPQLHEQIRHVVWSIVREAITKNPIWKGRPPPPPPPDEKEMAKLEILMELYEAGKYSEDEKAYIGFIRKWEGDSRPTDVLIEKTLGWGQSKAHRVKKSIVKKVIEQLNKI